MNKFVEKQQGLFKNGGAQYFRQLRPITEQEVTFQEQVISTSRHVHILVSVHFTEEANFQLAKDLGDNADQVIQHFMGNSYQLPQIMIASKGVGNKKFRVDLGGMTGEQAEAAIQERVDKKAQMIRDENDIDQVRRDLLAGVNKRLTKHVNGLGDRAIEEAVNWAGSSAAKWAQKGGATPLHDEAIGKLGHRIKCLEAQRKRLLWEADTKRRAFAAEQIAKEDKAAPEVIEAVLKRLNEETEDNSGFGFRR